MVIQSPGGWGWDRLRHAVQDIGSATPEEYWRDERLSDSAPVVRRVGIAAIWRALARGMNDFGASRTDVVFLCVIYPVIGLLLGALASGHGLLPLLFPLASGFALVGPFAAIGLYEMSRRREQGASVTWLDAFGVIRSPAIWPIVLLGMLLTAIFLLWLVVAQLIYVLTLGPAPPVSAGLFIRDVLTTRAGWTMIVVGVGVGLLFAILVLAISSVSFPLLLDRDAGIGTAVSTSVRVMAANPLVMVTWGLVVAGALVLGMLPLFVGLVVVLPVLGHATWHLYREVVER
jgi:uncharacterized membrane protein